MDKQIEILQAKRLATGSRKAYTSTISQFVVWLCSHNKELLGSEFLSRFFADNSDKPPTKSEIHSAVVQVLGPPPDLSCPLLKWDQITARVFLEWLISLPPSRQGKAKGMTHPSHSALKTHKSALKSLFSDFKEVANCFFFVVVVCLLLFVCFVCFLKKLTVVM